MSFFVKLGYVIVILENYRKVKKKTVANSHILERQRDSQGCVDTFVGPIITKCVLNCMCQSMPRKNMMLCCHISN